MEKRPESEQEVWKSVSCHILFFPWTLPKNCLHFIGIVNLTKGTGVLLLYTSSVVLVVRIAVHSPNLITRYKMVMFKEWFTGTAQCLPVSCFIDVTCVLNSLECGIVKSGFFHSWVGARNTWQLLKCDSLQLFGIICHRSKFHEVIFLLGCTLAWPNEFLLRASSL